MTKAIVVGVDGSDSAEQAVRWAAKEAADRRLPLRLVHAYVVIHAYTPVVLPMSALEVLEQEGKELLHDALRSARDVAPGIDVSTKHYHGSAAVGLIEESSTAEMVVLGSRGRGGFTGLLLGSVAVTLAAHGRCPVVVVRGTRNRNGGQVVVGVDSSPSSEPAIDFAFDEAARLHVPLVALHAWDDLSLYVKFSLPPYGVQWAHVQQEQRHALEERLAGWRDKYPDVPVELVVTPDRPAVGLLEAARGAQLLVVGSRGRGEVKGMLLGSTSQALLHHSSCTVAVVRGNC